MWAKGGVTCKDSPTLKEYYATLLFSCGCDCYESLKMEGFHDDDFGELYATDIQLPNATPKDDEEEEENSDVNSDSVNVEHENNTESDNGDCVASDSDSDDDGLKIVLNDDDLPAGVVNCSQEGHGDEPKLQCGRSRGGSMFENNSKANTSMGMASYILSLNKNRWNGDTGILNASSSSHVQCGYGSFLPWYWGIFDVNIDTLMEKPWKVTGVDITDYFNFGFDESTWKQYCASLEQLWRTSLQTGISVDDSAKRNQEAAREQTDPIISGNVHFPSSDCGLPKGRAIQVEDSIVERPPSIDVRRPRSRDSNIIEIKLLESSDDHSGSGNSIVMDASLEREDIVGNNRNILNSSSECDELLSEDQLEVVKISEDSSAQKRSGLIPGVVGDEHQYQADQHSDDTAPILEGEIEAGEGGGVDTFSSYPCWIESELSLGDQEHSLTSYTDSDSEASDNSVRDDKDKSLIPLRRKSMNSVVDTKESSSFYCKNSKNNIFNEKTANVAYNSRTRGPFRKEWRHQSARNESSYKMNKHIENDNDDVFTFFKSSARDPSLLRCQFVDYGKHKSQVLGSHKNRGASYNRGTKRSYYFGGEKVVDDLVTRHSKYYREDREIFRENTHRYDRKGGDAGNYFFKLGPQISDSEDRKRDWYHPGCGYSGDDLSPCSYRESRPFFSNHSCYPDKEWVIQRRAMADKSHFIERNYDNDFDECEFEFPNKSYRMSTSASEREMESLHKKHEEQFLHFGRDSRRSLRRERHCDRPALVLDNLCSGEMEDNCTHYQISNMKYRRQSYTDSVRKYAYGTRVNENFEGYGRQKHARDSRASEWSCGYTDGTEDEDLTIYPVEEYQFYRSPSKFLNLTEDEIICRRHEIHSTTLHAKVQSDDMKLQWRQLNMPSKGSRKHLKGSSEIMCRSKGGQAALRCGKSVNLIDGEGKSHVRSSKVLCSGRLEYVDQGIARKRRASVGFVESHKKIKIFNYTKYESNHENEKWRQNVPDQGQQESSDIEEGQIVTEEPYVEVSVSRRDVSQGAAGTGSVKNRLLQNENSSNQFIGGYDSQRILDSLAKMEKRRERFKQPITIKKEAEESLKLNNDSVVHTGEMKQHRPARKRRWLGD
ncbi:hypothetical protein RJT34_14595 [Clitoria ternatea]|uniref:Pre-mRNA polyadenylation factor Fip1 domain-containing protein n=1 Tax=Clitoria ternatea TaxID=43366 RepID=A0AAN9JTK4_CLITE